MNFRQLGRLVWCHGWKFAATGLGWVTVGPLAVEEVPKSRAVEEAGTAKRPHPLAKALEDRGI